MSIIDRRSEKNSTVGNRQKFMKRNKRFISDRIEKIIKNIKIKDIDTERKIKISNDIIYEPEMSYDWTLGDYDYILPGNTKYQKGNKVNRPNTKDGLGGAGNSGEGEDDFEFLLTKKEFLDIFFENMHLPNLIKKNLDITDFEYRQGGYSKDGLVTRLNLKKTFENKIARKLIAKSKGKKARYLDDTDLRYNISYKQVVPKRNAVMFCLLDTSGSMTEWKKLIAKKFFILLYLFLRKHYDSINIHFIRHTHEAAEVEEEEFFYDTTTGGTVVSTAFEVVIDIINKNYNDQETNFYIAQASDGDNWSNDNSKLKSLLPLNILPRIQYMAYIQIMTPDERVHQMKYHYLSLYDLYTSLDYVNLESELIYHEADVFKVLQKLFSK